MSKTGLHWDGLKNTVMALSRQGSPLWSTKLCEVDGVPSYYLGRYGEFFIMEEKRDMEEKPERVELGATGPIVLPPLDLTKHIGKRVKIAEVGEYKGKFGYYVLVRSAPVETLQNGAEISATKMLGLETDKDGKTGWVTGGKTAVFLTKMGVSHYRDLVGKEVMVQCQTNTKNGKDYLTVVPVPQGIWGENPLSAKPFVWVKMLTWPFGTQMKFQMVGPNGETDVLDKTLEKISVHSCNAAVLVARGVCQYE